jgi:hypothetical protein
VGDFATGSHAQSLKASSNIQRFRQLLPQRTPLAEFISFTLQINFSDALRGRPHEYGCSPRAVPCSDSQRVFPTRQQEYEQWRVRGEGSFT